MNDEVQRQGILQRDWRWPSARVVVLSLAISLFILLCALPAIYMFGLSFTGADGHLSFENYRRLLVEPRQRELLRTSALLGAGAAMLATLVGAPLGLLLARAGIRGKRWWRLALVIPLVVPPYVLALAWTWLDITAELTYSLTGAIIVLGVSFYPLAMLATEASTASRWRASAQRSLWRWPPCSVTGARECGRAGAAWLISLSSRSSPYPAQSPASA